MPTPHLDPELLSAYLDEEVSTAERAEVEAHLPTCAVCQAELATLQGTVSLLQRLPEVPLPRAFYVTEAMLNPAPPVQRGWGWRRWFTPAAAALAALLVLVVIVRGPLGGSSGPLSSDSAARESAPIAAGAAAGDAADDGALAESSTMITASEAAGIQTDDSEPLPEGDALPGVAMEAPDADATTLEATTDGALPTEPQPSPEAVPPAAPAPAPEPGAYRWLALALLAALLIGSTLLWRRRRR